MPSRALLILVVALLAGVAAPAASPSPVLAVSCPSAQPLSMRQVWRLWRAGAAKDSGPGEGSTAAFRRCFGSSPFRIRAWIGPREVIDPSLWVGAPKPSWWHYSGLTLQSTGRLNRYGDPKGVIFWITVPPGFGNLHRLYGRRWVIVTVRTNDPRARACRPDGPKDAQMTKKEAIAYCKSAIVLLRIARAVVLPATDTLPVRAVPGGGRVPSPHPLLMGT
jgi:hypothetical protein